MTIPPAAKPERCPECGAPGDVIAWEGSTTPPGEDNWRCGRCGAPWSTSRPAYTAAAVEAVTQAVTNEHDFADWLAGVLARVAARKGSSDALTARRSGSWEASLVQQLVKGTVGYDDEALDAYQD